MHLYTYLALGDSYTIGEGIPVSQSFPYQLVQQMRQQGVHIGAPEIVAKTGWTTDELQLATQHYRFLPKYDFVSLLIGVNNQYRGREVAEYKMEFEQLLKQAIQLANNKASHVAVISIPDYGNTPFSKDRDREQIARDIDVFNGISRALSVQYKVTYIDITPETRLTEGAAERVVEDGLHPSASVYQSWAEKLVPVFSPLTK